MLQSVLIMGEAGKHMGGLSSLGTEMQRTNVSVCAPLRARARLEMKKGIQRKRVHRRQQYYRKEGKKHLSVVPKKD